MNIGIDIDDTLTESFDYFQPFVAEYFGVEVEELRHRNISYSNLPEEWKADELGFCRTYYDRFAADTPFKKDAAWGVDSLRKAGHKIIIITGRSTLFYTDPYKTTEKELNNGGIVYDKLICTLDKGSACLEEKIDILIDDLPANCAAAAGLGIKTILFQSKANQDMETEFTRLPDWKAVVDAVGCVSGRIREIDASEADKLLECIIQLSEYHNQISVNFKGSFPSRPYDETIRIFTESLQNKDSYIAVVEDAGKIVGFCKVDVACYTGKLDYLVVLREYRQKGFGRQLMDWAMNTFRKHHIRHIEVKVIDGNDAIHLYEKYGFQMNSHILCYCEE